MAEQISQQGNETSVSIDINTILKDLRKRWYVILIIGCLAAMACFVFANEKYAPVYQTSATFLVSDQGQSQSTYSSLQTTTSLTEVFKTLVDSSQLKSLVAEDMGYKTLPGTITASQVPETNMITLSVSAASPKLCYQVMHSLLKTYPVFTDEIIPNAVLDVLEKPVIPTLPSNSASLQKWTLLGFAGGIILSLLAIAAFSFIKDTIKCEADVNKKLTTKLLVSIPSEKKKHHGKNVKNSKMALSINNPTQSFTFIEAFKKLRTKIESQNKHHGYKTFVVTSTLENEGKSTVAANLALALAKKDYSVLLIDVDVRKPAIYKFFELDIDKDHSLSEYLNGNIRFSNVIIRNDTLNLSFIADNKPQRNASALISSESMEYLINTAKEQFDYVIIDTPPLALVADAEEVINHADATVLVVRQDLAKTIAINDSLDIISQLSTKTIGCVFNDNKNIFGTKASSHHYGYGYGYNYDYGYGYGKRK